jgi:hypothetical protein
MVCIDWFFINHHRHCFDHCFDSAALRFQMRNKMMLDLVVLSAGGFVFPRRFYGPTFLAQPAKVGNSAHRRNLKKQAQKKLLKRS